MYVFLCVVRVHVYTHVLYWYMCMYVFLSYVGVRIHTHVLYRNMCMHVFLPIYRGWRRHGETYHQYAVPR